MLRFVSKMIFSLLLATSCQLAADSSEGQKKLDELREHFHGPSIRVQILQDVDGAQVEVKGPYNLYDPRTGKLLDRAYLSSSYYMYPTISGLKWGQEFPGIYQLLIIPDKAETTVLVAGTEYRGWIYMYQIKGMLGAVNEVSLEDFVASILSSHISQEITEKEALAALAIALRTEALYWISIAKNPYWDIKAGTVGYRGCAIERHDTPFEEALKSSRDLVMKKIGSNDLVTVRWFSIGESMAPVHEMQNLAKEGKDARAILEKMYGEIQIVKVQNLTN